MAEASLTAPALQRPASPHTDVTARWFLVSAIGYFFIVGIIALTKTKDPQVGGRGLAIGGIAVGCVAILMTGCMLSILLFTN